MAIKMRMSVILAGRTVRSPSSMSYTNSSDHLLSGNGLFQLIDWADFLLYKELTAVQDTQSGTVVTALF